MMRISLLSSPLLLVLLACGDDPVAAAGGAADADVEAASTEVEAVPAQDPKRRRRPRVDARMVKIMLGNETPAPAAPVPTSDALVALGNKLYHWQGLSADGASSCASCHDLSAYGSDGKQGHAAMHKRNAPSTYNAHRQFAQFWDGRQPAVEKVVATADKAPGRHGVGDDAAAKCKADEEVAGLFAKAFPDADDAITIDNVGVALGAFLRTLETKSKWDEYLGGNQRALDNDALFGLKTFMDVGCTQCHMNKALGGQMFQKLGLLAPYDMPDKGRGALTGQEYENYMFKVPTLINVEKTAPYYHDGSIATLAEAVEHMAKVQLRRELKQEQTDAIVAFLKSLTGPLPAAFAPKPK